ncbi:MAG: tRNA uridine-5-carboxymethylaminomethyl(34) synthesis GTPase MnmE [Pseudohongiellaceae bacterium]
MSFIDNDTISAIATPPGSGGISIVRVSGPQCFFIAKTILGFEPTPRHAHYCPFNDHDGEPIEQGIALYFPNPNSFTGEDILELQGHGGSHIVQSVLKRTLELGARLAEPGEFTERAFLNGKIDLVQAEAIADLIEAASEQAAKSAMRTFQGGFSNSVNDVVIELIKLRVQVEAHIDFSEEELDLNSATQIKTGLESSASQLNSIIKNAKNGVLLKNGLSIAIAGKPNAGKSSLLNALANIERAIVTDIPGTTRDVLQEQISIDGLPLNIIDTAGLRDSEDIVEQEGIKRARVAIENADQILLVLDGSDSSQNLESAAAEVLTLMNSNSDEHSLKNCCVIVNKVDLLKNTITFSNNLKINNQAVPLIPISAKSHCGLDALREHLKESVNYSSVGENSFIARERHLIALKEAYQNISNAITKLESQPQWDLLGEDLRVSQQELNKITGEFSSDDLLGEIFSNFCVGK